MINILTEQMNVTASTVAGTTRMRFALKGLSSLTGNASDENDLLEIWRV